MKEYLSETIVIVFVVRVFPDQLNENELFVAKNNQLKPSKACELMNKS